MQLFYGALVTLGISLTFSNIPLLDRDKDAISDSLDLCPNEAELLNFYEDLDGCPDKKPNPIRNGPIPNLYFASGKNQPDTTRMLDTLAKLLSVYPGTHVELRGHTDDLETTSVVNLSIQRAEFVKSYLVKLGIMPNRLFVSGFEANRPLQPNRSGAVRMINRRVEIYVR